MTVTRRGRKPAASEKPMSRHPQASANEQPKSSAQQPHNQEANDRSETAAKNASQETPFWEKMVGVLGLLIVLAVLGFLLYEAFQPQSEPQITTEILFISQQPGGYLVQFKASNHGRQTAAAVVVEGSLFDPASPAQPLETAEITFDYIPDQSDRTGAFVFEHNPTAYDLRLQVKGFMDP
jgi:uncharacterized protein (TIGR02588 family)